MGAGLSLLLDLMRFIAALTVVTGHLTQKYFSVGWPGATRLAIEAVGVFFLLSGFVIRHTMRRKDKTLAQYAVSRAARIYSVVIPALVLTLCLDSISRTVNPDYYAFWSEQATNPLGRFALSGLFLGEAWNLDVSPLSNSPFWSLNYECVYYAAFGFWFYLRGPLRVLSLAGVAALIGPKVFLLFPIWLMGVWLYDNLSRLTMGRRGSIALFLGAGAVYAIWFGLRLPERTELALLAALGPQWGGRLGPSLHIADFYVVASVCGAVIVAATGVMGKLEPVLQAWSRPIRFAASATFSTYLYHFPLLVFFGAIWPYDHGNSLAKVTVLALTLVCCLLLSRVTETRKDLAAQALVGLGRMVGRLGRNLLRPPALPAAGVGGRTLTDPIAFLSPRLSTPNDIADGDKHDR